MVPIQTKKKGDTRQNWSFSIEKESRKIKGGTGKKQKKMKKAAPAHKIHRIKKKNRGKRKALLLENEGDS